MKKILVLFLIVIVSVVGNSQNKKVFIEKSNDTFISSSPENITTDSLIIWAEDWEGTSNWTSADETAVGAKWHLDEFNAYGGSGLSWWMGDPIIGSADGGYDNHWYQVLDTDTITLPDASTPSLTFYHRYNVENPAGAEAPYTGWDGMNVRISTDNGETWIVLQDTAAAYNVTSLYSFGFEHGEGPNVPGWGGSLLEWDQVSFDLTEYAGQTVQIRFAFASDPGYSTADEAALFGWQVDEIAVMNNTDILYQNSGAEDGITPGENVVSGGDLWRISEGTGLPSGSFFAEVNDTATNTYLPNMINSLISEYFYLPDTLDQLFFDFFLQGDFTDPDAFPDVDFWTVFFQKQGETSWRYLSNITQSSSGQNFVYSDALALWGRFSANYSTGLVNLAPIAGDSVRMKITWFSDADAPSGRALQVDDLIIYSPITPVGVEDKNILPKQYNLAQNYPNPFNPSTKIKFALPVKSNVVITLYNILGKELKQLVNNNFSAGEHTINLNAENLSTGVYFYTLKAIGENGKAFSQTKKLTLMK